ncbi:MAG: hypothetical protein WBL70_17700, partial [Candidatus Acidiferrales bacterium]
ACDTCCIHFQVRRLTLKMHSDIFSRREGGSMQEALVLDFSEIRMGDAARLAEEKAVKSWRSQTSMVFYRLQHRQRFAA